MTSLSLAWALHFSKAPWLIPVVVGSDQDCLTLEISLDHLSCGVGVNFSHISAILVSLLEPNLNLRLLSCDLVVGSIQVQVPTPPPTAEIDS